MTEAILIVLLVGIYTALNIFFKSYFKIKRSRDNWRETAVLLQTRINNSK